MRKIPKLVSQMQLPLERENELAQRVQVVGEEQSTQSVIEQAVQVVELER